MNEIPKLTGDLSQLFQIYLDMVNMMLNSIHFNRVENWEGFLETIFLFLPYSFR